MLEVALNEIYWYNCIGKSKKHKGNLWMIAVVPRAGTWIETASRLRVFRCVDMSVFHCL